MRLETDVLPLAVHASNSATPVFDVAIDGTAEPCDIVQALATFAIAVLDNRRNVSDSESFDDKPAVLSFAEGQRRNAPSSRAVR